jgi:5,10-methylenetetrahydrofolate reductase
MSKDAAATINMFQKDFAGKDFFRTQPILDVKLDVKIGGGG